MATPIRRDTFDSVYRAHFADVRRFIFQFVQDVSAADELTQDTFVKALGAWDGYRGDAPERIWLLRIARNVCLDYVRSPRSRASEPLSPDAMEEDRTLTLAMRGTEGPPSVEEAALKAQMTECVQSFVVGLPETLRTPLILHDMHGLTNEEIAHVTGCSLEAAKMRLHRARGKLRELMEQRCELFHDERNVLSCLPAPPDRAFISLDELADQLEPSGASPSST
jgi:RNA polymerase sigma-70 factor (ECF subfamily)